jgi:nuclear pore complex protein Nup155
LTCAQVQDPDGAGLECWHAGMAPSDPRYELAQTRLNCYDLVLDSLRVFEEKCKDKLTTAPTTGVAALDDPESVRSHAYELAFASDDEMFHSTLYDWLISRDLADDLLEVRRLAFELMTTFDTSFLDEAAIPGGISSTRTCNRAKIPTFMAILR